MKEIPLTRGYVAIVDDCDYDYLMQWKWYASSHLYAVRKTSRKKSIDGRQKEIKMHRVVMELAGFNIDRYKVDHKNGETLLNVRSNLRVATNSQNIASSHKPIRNKTGFLGVSKRTDRLKGKYIYSAAIKFDGKDYKLGYFATPEEAAQAYNEAAIRFFGEFARLNIIASIPQPFVA